MNFIAKDARNLEAIGMGEKAWLIPHIKGSLKARYSTTRIEEPKRLATNVQPLAYIAVLRSGILFSQHIAAPIFPSGVS